MINISIADTYVLPVSDRPRSKFLMIDSDGLYRDYVHSQALSSLPLVFVATISAALYSMTDARYDCSLSFSAWHRETYPH